jgi:hypothetical protein
MAGSYEGSAVHPARWLNAVALQNAVLCAECDFVSDSPHDQCQVCGSRSLVNMWDVGRQTAKRTRQLDPNGDRGACATGGGAQFSDASSAP